jgi:hypothetical protein
LYVKLSKCEFGKTTFVYLGHIVGGGQLKIDPSKIGVIVNFPETKSVIEIQSFLGAVQYWRRFISKFSFIEAPLHALTNVKNTFQWEGKQQKYFDTLKEKISIAPILALRNLQNPFEIETDVNKYAMGAVLMQYCNHIYYNIHTDHQPLPYLQAQTKLQQSRRYRWMGFLQQLHLVIKYKKGTSNKVVDILYIPPIVASIILKNTYLSHDSYVEQYAIDENFKKVYENLTHGVQVDNYFLQGKLLYHIGNLCIPTIERVHVIRESHTSLVSGHWGRKNCGSFAEVLLLASNKSNCN